jgi:hypothetical protein
MVEDKDPGDSFDDVLTDLTVEEPEENYEALLRGRSAIRSITRSLPNISSFRRSRTCMPR